MEMSQNYNYVPFNIQPGFNETTKFHQEDYLLQWILITFKPLIHFYQTEILHVQLFVLKNKRLPIPQRINCAVNYWLDWVGGRGGEVTSLIIGWKDQVQSAWWYNWWYN